MLMKTVRIGIVMMLVVVFGLDVAGAQAAQVKSIVNLRREGNYSYGDVYGIPWNGSYDSGTWDTSKLYQLNFETDAKTFGELQAEYENKLGYPIVMLARVSNVTFTFTGAGVSLSPLASFGVPVGPYYYYKPAPSDPLLGWYVNVAIFKTVPVQVDVTRLTLFGYVNDNNKSCVLWSLDGSRPVNVDTKCGGGSELACTVKLVEKDLKYDCEGSYDWLGEQIVNDPKWLAWAHNFASMNGNK
jgi:hypothetical protein